MGRSFTSTVDPTSFAAIIRSSPVYTKTHTSRLRGRWIAAQGLVRQEAKVTSRSRSCSPSATTSPSISLKVPDGCRDAQSPCRQRRRYECEARIFVCSGCVQNGRAIIKEAFVIFIVPMVLGKHPHPSEQYLPHRFRTPLLPPRHLKLHVL